MDIQNDLLFGLFAFQSGAVEADRLAETCALWSRDGAMSLADRLVERGCLTAEQKIQIENLVSEELKKRGGDVEAALAATMDGRFLEAIRAVNPLVGSDLAHMSETLASAADYELLGSLRPSEDETSNRYTRTHLHAKGGMGQVWVARDRSLGRQIALKELRPDQKGNSVILSRFLYEARITAQLEHPGIVPVYELGGGSIPFYTMRFVKGRTLSEAARSYHQERLAGTPDSLRQVNLLNAFLGVCHAIAYAHSRGVIHRDLKGQNVVLGDFGEVIVLDWGIAKEIGPFTTAPPVSDGDVAASFQRGGADNASHASVLGKGTFDPNETLPPGTSQSDASLKRLPSESGAGSEGTMQGQLLGTPAFMAPEQASGLLNQIDQRTDVYGLGAVLYEILTGRPPFDGEKTAEILRRVREEPPRPPRELNPTVDPALQAICLKALSKRKEQRYTSATEMAQDVQRYLADQPVHACPDPWARRALRWARRHRTVVATAAGLLLTSTIALGVGTVLVSRERNEAKFQGNEARQAVDDMYTKVAENWLEDRLDPLQKEFLEKTLAHYQTLTGQAAGDPAVRLEHARAFERMGDIQRKLGNVKEANTEYRRALAILEPLHAGQPDDGEVRRALALTQTRLGDLMLRRGQNDQAEPLYHQALGLQEVQAAAPNSTTEDRWLLGRTLKSQADLLRLKGDFTGARSVYQRAISTLEKATAKPAPSDISNDLALAENAQGQLLLDLNEKKLAEDQFRGALALLGPLVAEYPTVPRFRESLATTSNSLGLIEERDGRSADCEVHYRRELAEEERLAQDFPDRPEFRRELARASMNLGNLLESEGRMAEAQAMLRRAVSLNTDLTSKQPEDVQVRLDLSKARTNLGYLFQESGHVDQAIAELERARNLSLALVKQVPDSPRYREQLAGSLEDLALAYEAAGKPAEPTYLEALKIDEKLVSEFPDNPNYKINLARCLRNLGPVLASTNRPDQAEACYARGLEAVKHVQTPEGLREQFAILNNLGEMRQNAGRPGAEEAERQALAIIQELAARKPVVKNDLIYLAIIQNNLGDAAASAGRPQEAEQFYATSIEGFTRLSSENPKDIDLQTYLGSVYDSQAQLWEKTGQREKARQPIEAAVAHEQQAVELTDGKVAAYRIALRGHFGILAKICLELHAYDDAMRAAVEMSKVPSASGQGYVDAAKLLAHDMAVANQDAQLDPPRREQIGRQCSGRIAILLRQALDANAKLAEKIKSDPELSPILARPEFQNLLGNLVNPGPDRAH
jgi:serine/threonine protein kinase/tetratricopeptide (TPR) repeat protein